MKHRFSSLLAALLCLTLLGGMLAVPVQAASALPESITYGPVATAQEAAQLICDAAQDVMDTLTLPPATLFSLRGLIISLDKLVSFFVRALLTAIETLLPPARSREDLASYTSEHFLPGYQTFVTAAAAGARWKLGYDSRSIMPADFGEKAYRMGGYDFNKFATETVHSQGGDGGAEDYLKVRTVVLDDGSGRGAVAFAALDVIGLSNADVRAIRAKLQDLTDNGSLAAINVSSTHTHSAIDSQGLWGNDLLTMLGTNVGAGYLPSLIKPIQGIDQTFLQTMVDQTAASIREAFRLREAGELLYSRKAAPQYFSDKIDPFIAVDDVYRLRFVPDQTGAKETVIASFGAHPERVGMITGDNPGNVVSADFVPYMEKVVKEQGAPQGTNFLYLQGPIGTRISADVGPACDGMPYNRLEGTQRFGQEMGYFLLGMGKTEAQCAALYADQYAADLARVEETGSNPENYSLWYKGWDDAPVTEQSVDPYLNIALAEVLAEVKNPILKAAGKMWLANNKMVVDHKTGKTYTLTEVGYLELGGQVKVLLQPGETSPELIVGGPNLSSSGSVSGKAFPYAPLRETVDQDLIVFDLMNDSIGYIIPDNDSTTLLLRYVDGKFTDTGSLGGNLNDSLLLTFSNKIASTMISAFLDLVQSVKK
ncbi:MAG: hypothetical protein LBJ11_02985 [Oscillospiraceae bacterium]|jgi:hypothetical protein|nr:hypothetical protein [Oscillospiraceae bacterium]